MKDAKTPDNKTRIHRKDLAEAPRAEDLVNRDPLSGEHGAHPVGTGVGAADGAASSPATRRSASAKAQH